MEKIRLHFGGGGGGSIGRRMDSPRTAKVVNGYMERLLRKGLGNGKIARTLNFALTGSFRSSERTLSTDLEKKDKRRARLNGLSKHHSSCYVREEPRVAVGLEGILPKLLSFLL